jgi:hypothetical protein
VLTLALMTVLHQHISLPAAANASFDFFLNILVDLA